MDGCETEEGGGGGGGGGGGRGGGSLEPGGGRPQWRRWSGGGRWARGMVGGDGRLLGDIASVVPGVPAASSNCCTNGRVSANLRNCCSTSGSSSGEQMLHRSSTGPFCESCAQQNFLTNFFPFFLF